MTASHACWSSHSPATRTTVHGCQVSLLDRGEVAFGVQPVLPLLVEDHPPRPRARVAPTPPWASPARRRSSAGRRGARRPAPPARPAPSPVVRGVRRAPPRARAAQCPGRGVRRPTRGLRPRAGRAGCQGARSRRTSPPIQVAVAKPRWRRVLDERPLVVDRCGAEPPRAAPAHGSRWLSHNPSMTAQASRKPSASWGSHLHPGRASGGSSSASTRGGDVDAVDDDVAQLTADPDVVHLDTGEPAAGEQRRADRGAAEVDVVDAHLGQVRLPEARACAGSPSERSIHSGPARGSRS